MIHMGQTAKKMSYSVVISELRPWSISRISSLDAHNASGVRQPYSRGASEGGLIRQTLRTKEDEIHDSFNFSSDFQLDSSYLVQVYIVWVLVIQPLTVSARYVHNVFNGLFWQIRAHRSNPEQVLLCQARECRRRDRQSCLELELLVIGLVNLAIVN